MSVCDEVRILLCFFKQKTAYELRISDWSSDVCSSDLVAHGLAQGVVPALGQGEFLDQAHVGVLQRFGGGGDLLQRGVAVAVEGAAEFGEAGLECFEVLDRKSVV